MVGNTGTLMTMRFVRSKLRKREETSPNSLTTPAAIEAQQPNFGTYNRSGSATNCDCPHQDQQLFTTSSLIDCNKAHGNIFNQEHTVTFTRTSGTGGTIANDWEFPPKVPTPNLYSCINNDFLAVDNDKHGFKGFRKQFSGRFKRLLIAKKPDAVAPVIPPELKPQLKTIYVY